MTRSKTVGFAVALVVTLLSLPLLAQTKTPQPLPPVPVPGSRAGQTPGAKRPQREPCFEKAGISKSVLEQRRAIREQTRSQVAAVCNDRSLTPQQRREKIHQIREQAHQQIEGLMTPQQRSALESCRKSRGAGVGRHGVGGLHRGESPCGELPGASGRGPKPPVEREDEDDER